MSRTCGGDFKSRFFLLLWISKVETNTNIFPHWLHLKSIRKCVRVVVIDANAYPAINSRGRHQPWLRFTGFSPDTKSSNTQIQSGHLAKPWGSVDTKLQIHKYKIFRIQNNGLKLQIHKYTTADWGSQVSFQIKNLQNLTDEEFTRLLVLTRRCVKLPMHLIFVIPRHLAFSKALNILPL